MEYAGSLNRCSCAGLCFTAPDHNSPEHRHEWYTVQESRACAAFKRGGLWTRALECSAFTAAALARGENRNCWSLDRMAQALLPSRDEFWARLRECVHHEMSSSAEHRPTSLLRDDLPLAPFCFNVGLLLAAPPLDDDAPDVARGVGCAYPWDAEAGRGDAAARQRAVLRSEPCSPAQTNQSAGLAATRATNHRRECATGRRAPPRPRCCFERVEQAVAQQRAFWQRQQNGGGAVCVSTAERNLRARNHTSKSSNATTAHRGREQAGIEACCRRWTDAAWEHNEIERSWRPDDILGAYYVRSQDEPFARAVHAMLVNASSGVSPSRQIELVRIADAHVPQRVLSGARLA